MDEKTLGKFNNKNKTAIVTIFLIAVIFFIVSGSVSASQESELFEEAYSYYLSYNPNKALELFNAFLKEFPLSSATDSVLFWKAKALIQLNKTSEAKEIFKKIKELYPESYFYNFAQKELENLNIQTIEIKGVVNKNTAESSDKKTSRQEEKKAPAVGLKDETIIALNKEKDNALAKVKTLELKTSELNLILEKLQEKQKGWKDLEEYIKTLKDNRVILENRIKDMDKRLSEADKTISMLNKQSIDKNAMLKEIKTLQDSQIENENQASLYKKQLENTAQKYLEEKNSSIAKLRDAESTIKNSNESLSKLKTETQRFHLEKEALLRRIEESDGMLKHTNDILNKLKAEYAELKKSYDAVLIKNKESGSKLKASSEWIKQYDKPFVKIANVNYSIPQIIAENIISSLVISKLNNSTVRWRSNDAYENFIIEQILFNKAKESGIKENIDALILISKKHAFNDKEKEYLAKFLIIDDFVKNKFLVQTVEEKEIADYYKTNKNNYLISAEDKFVKALVLNYAGENEIAKALVAVELRKDAYSGISFENICRKNPDLVICRQMKYDELPDWIKDRIHELKDGELSDVISIENQFVIFQVQLKKPKYKKYEDVFNEIKQILLSKKALQNNELQAWLKEIRKEAEEIR